MFAYVYNNWIGKPQVTIEAPHFFSTKPQHQYRSFCRNMLNLSLDVRNQQNIC